MFRLTYKNLLANKVRFALTTFGVILAVSFVVSAFVLGDGLRSSFTKVSEDVTAGVDLEVRNVADFGDTPPLPADTPSTVAAVDGVADAVPNIEAADNAVRPIRANGENIPTAGPPQLAFNWIDNEQLSPFTLVDGAPPQIGQFTMDVDSAAKYGFVIGHTYQVMVPDGRVDLTLSGTSSFGADNSTLGAVLMQMNTDQASELFGIKGISNVAVQVGRWGQRGRRSSRRCRSRAHGRGRRPRDGSRRNDLRVHQGDRHRRQHLVGIRWSRTVRVDLHHLQHLRHRLVAAQSRARTAAHRRCRSRSRFGVRSWVRLWS